MGWAEEDVYRVVLQEYQHLRYTQPVPTGGGTSAEKQMSFKQRQREIKRLLAEAALRAEQAAQRQARPAEKERMYRLRQEKRRGH
jgi:hypothetical protein